MAVTRACGFRFLAAAFVTAGLSGCGGTGDISGKVFSHGTPLVSGTVMVVASDGMVHQGVVQPDGSYTIVAVRVGDVRLAVNSPDPTTPLVRKSEDPPDPEDVRRRAALKARWSPIPAKYNSPSTSGLTLSVKRGMNAHDIDLN
jgi:hypothetical protein